MSDTVETLILDLLDWLMARDRTYEEVMDAWRTSCPRLPVWEDASDRGLIAQEEVNGRRVVRVTPLGLALLGQRKVPHATALGASWRATEEKPRRNAVETTAPLG